MGLAQNSGLRGGPHQRLATSVQVDGLSQQTYNLSYTKSQGRVETCARKRQYSVLGTCGYVGQLSSTQAFSF